MRASGWRVLGTESQGTGACTMLWVVGKGTALKSSQGTKIVGQQDGGWVVSNAQKKKETAKKIMAHKRARRKQAQMAHKTASTDTALSTYTAPKQKIKVQTKPEKENTARYDQTPGPKDKINNTPYGNRKWSVVKVTETGESGGGGTESPGKRTKQNQKRRVEGHTNQAQ